eukprot:12028752-Alexandrium_andersonii.AAC.1
MFDVYDVECSMQRDRVATEGEHGGDAGYRDTCYGNHMSSVGQPYTQHCNNTGDVEQHGAELGNGMGDGAGCCNNAVDVE